MTSEIAMLGGGCFWGVEEVFRTLDGVVATEVGYAGGEAPEPTYEQVCSGKSGHAEVVRIEFDPSKISYGRLLDVFFASHRPTELNRQGSDIGSQYRSVIFTHSPEQEASATEAVRALDASGKYRTPVVTKVEPATTYARAEEHHQKYLFKRGESSCQL